METRIAFFQILNFKFEIQPLGAPLCDLCVSVVNAVGERFHHRDTEIAQSFTEKFQILLLLTRTSDRAFSKPKSSRQSKSPSRFLPISTHSSRPRHIFP